VLGLNPRRPEVVVARLAKQSANRPSPESVYVIDVQLPVDVLGVLATAKLATSTCTTEKALVLGAREQVVAVIAVVVPDH
jgi:hypothetical protein